jgi:glycosidase
MAPRVLRTLLSFAALTAAIASAGYAPDALAQAKNKARSVLPYPTHSIENEVFYFVMPDRFENGSDANNEGDKSDRWSSGGYDPSDKSLYHGGDIVGLQKRLDYLKGMGISAIWMTPILKNKTMQGDSSAYHGYWTLDFTKLDPHLGTNDEMKAFIKAAHARGIKVYFDIIANHTADVISYKECHKDDGSFRDGLTSCEYKTLAQVAAGNKYTPFVPAGQEKIKVPAWLNDPKVYHNQGDSTWSGENSVYGDFVGLDDVDTDNPEVVKGMIEIYKNLISDWKPDGFRIDTVKHVNTGFWQAFAPAVLMHAREVVGIKHFTMFGEVYSGDPRLLSYYTTVGKVPSVLDFGFQAAAASVVATNGPAGTMDKFFALDDMFNDADSSANQLVTFLGNHDMGRFGKFLKDGGAKEDADLLARYKVANALMFMSRGVPVIYYGDEQGFTGDDGDKDAREDMFPSKVKSYNDNVLIGTKTTTADSNFDTRHPLYRSIAELSALKRQHPVLGNGIQMARANSDRSGKVLTFSRVDLKSGVEYLMAFNFAPGESKTVTLPAAAPRYQPVHGGGAPKVSSGQLSVTIPAMNFVVLKASGLPTSPPATPVLAGVKDGTTVAEMAEITVEVPGIDKLALPQYQVLFEASVNGAAYQKLAVDNNAPYRLFWNTSALTDGSAVKLRASLSNLVEPPRTAEVAFTVDARSPMVNLIYENAGGLKTALINSPDGTVSVHDDADPSDVTFTTRFDWGKAASRTLVFADLAKQKGQATVVEKPIVLDRNTVMKLAKADAAGKLAVDLYVNSEGAFANQPNKSGTMRERLKVDAGDTPPLPAELNVRGGINGWGSTPMAYLGNGTYRVSMAAKEGDVEFKYADKTWSAINLGQPFGEAGLTGGPNPGNLLLHVEHSTMHDFTVVVAKDSAGKQVVLHAIRPDYGPFAQAMFLNGKFDASGKAKAMGFDGSVYRTEVALQPGSYDFKLGNADGSANAGSGLKLVEDVKDLEVSAAADGMLSMKVGSAAKYVFTARPEDAGKAYTLEIAQGGAAGPGNAPFGEIAVFVRGELPGDIELAYVGGGIYETMVVLDPANKTWGDDGVSALKVGDADWAKVNFGAAGDATLVPGTPKPLSQGSNTNLTYAAPQGVYKVSVNAVNPKAPTLTLTPLSKDYLVVHYGRPDSVYTGWGLHAWGDIVDGLAPEWVKPTPFTGKTAFGRFAVVPMKAATKLGFIVHNGDNKNSPADLGYTPAGNREIWIVGGDANIYESAAAAEAAKAAARAK